VQRALAQHADARHAPEARGGIGALPPAVGPQRGRLCEHRPGRRGGDGTASSTLRCVDGEESLGTPFCGRSMSPRVGTRRSKPDPRVRDRRRTGFAARPRSGLTAECPPAART
jgi:hypothetical protein